MILASQLYGQNSNKVISIYYFAGGGNYNYTTLIGSDSASINKHCQGNEGYPQFCAKFCVTPNIVDYISEYISGKCNRINNRTEASQEGFYIDIISENHIESCYVIGESLSKSYFEGFIKWIKISPYKEKCKKIIEDFEPYIR